MISRLQSGIPGIQHEQKTHHPGLWGFWHLQNHWLFEAKKGQCSYVFLTYPWTFWLHDMLLLRRWGKIATLQTLTSTSSLDLYWWKNRNIIWDMYIYKYIYVELCLKIRRNCLVYELVNGPFSESTFVQLHFDCLFPNSSDPRVSISKRMITGCNKSSNS